MSVAFDEHREAAFFENLRFLRECGLPEDQIAKRLGTTLGALQKKEGRRERRDRDQDRGRENG